MSANPNPKPEPTPPNLIPIQKLTKDLKAATATLSRDEARFLVDSYYVMQDQRIRFDGQVRSIERTCPACRYLRTAEEAKLVEGKIPPCPKCGNDAKEPHEILLWFGEESGNLERQVAIALGRYANRFVLGRWAQSIPGIGPVITAGLLAHIEIDRCPTVGNIWRFAGLDPSVKWLGREGATKVLKQLATELDSNDWETMIPEVAKRINRNADSIRRTAMRGPKGQELEHITKKSMEAAIAKRPWNASLKTLCWKIGESFVMVSGLEDDYYGHVWKERKELETAKNERLEFREQAMAILAAKPDHAQKKILQSGMLSPGHIHARAKRYAVKLFLAHWHDIAYRLKYGHEPPKPYIIEHGGHTHFIAAPNMYMLNNPEGLELLP